MSTNVRFPSFEFLEALQQQANEAPSVFDSLDPADAYFAVGIGDYAFAVEIEGKECVGLARGVNPNDVDFFLTGSNEAWSEMIQNIIDNDGADSSHRIQALVEAGTALELAEGDEAAREAFQSHAAWIQAFFDLTKNLTIEFE
jgi:hypothetical protein